ncbi:bifunctional folylpolyglutamate synthase/dihydrofolate synthase [Dyadobacter pollutisoli]|uniref:Dihydrofolate synthase/folylpolyglutamate synthase n=1 Tax=Dyadobacter pollutisoli TaxID=2910158 RepID=A0A9E8NCR6_9BACT|nr:folylpolyglutamate synthase/dihydrofolate synthase family protein [Dyadobacter pollutisoli]WAC14240.1 bifunctional folylpolyglutamate synthase/dihydrofolate synthase [Dyadobacter pollutisoli]
MNYQETLDYLYSRLPVFQNIGARAFKPGLHTTRELCKSLGDPQTKYPTIHVAGTNGKGSTSHMLAAILQQAGYRVGLYTSPHLKDFRERIRVDGGCVDEEFIVKFTNGQRSNIDRLNPSFFEVTVAMAFSYFLEANVDVAVIEVGMGGRLDSTNIITPVVSVITNISLDHTQFLGDTLAKIASEKAGIIKPEVPVVVSEYQNEEISDVIIDTAEQLHAPIVFGSEKFNIQKAGTEAAKLLLHVNEASGSAPGKDLRLDLTGSYQVHNLAGVLATVDVLNSKGWKIEDYAVETALESVIKLTGLKGRWQQLGTNPLIYCDTAHNTAGLTETINQFAGIAAGRRRFVIGFVGDKDITTMLGLFPANADYYFCEPSNMRALTAGDLQAMALKHGLKGERYPDVNAALKQAIKDSVAEDAIYVGGSTFVVADLEQL